MKINEEKTVDMLSTQSVSILTRKVLIDGEMKSQVGENHRRTYLNSVSGRRRIVEGADRKCGKCRVCNMGFGTGGRGTHHRRGG